MQNYKKITVSIIFFLAVIFLLPNTASAQNIWGSDTLTSLNLGTQDLGDTVAGIINIALGFLGVIAIGIILYGGFLWMTSNGNAERIDKAKKTLINGFIGLLIIVSAYSIVLFLFGDAMDTMFGRNTGTSGGGYVPSTEGLGAEVLDSHYPPRYARGVARNTNIFVTFTEDMNFETIVDCAPTGPGTGLQTCGADPAHLKIEAKDGSDPVPSNQLQVTFDNDNPVSFSINPYGNSATDHLGTETEPKTYNVILDGFRTANDQNAFRLGNVYVWEFTVSTEVDLTPPVVTSVYPVAGDTVPLNTVVQVNFSEPVNPILATGVYAPPANTFTNITLTRTDTSAILEGYYESVNQYRAIEFLTTNDCGTNSCGDPIYCLPEGAYQVQGEVLAVIEDMAGNALNTDGDTNFGEPIDDRYPGPSAAPWRFDVTDTIETVPPTLVEMSPVTSVALEDPLSLRFNERLMAGSVNGRNIGIERRDPISGVRRSINYWASVSNAPALDTILIHHDPFTPSTDYFPKLKSGIKNMTQNCWYPCDCTGSNCWCNNDPNFLPLDPDGENNCLGGPCTGQ